MSVLSRLYYGNEFAGLVQAEWTKRPWSFETPSPSTKETAMPATTTLDRVPDARVVTPDELTLIKTTVAAGATDAELKLFLFDCSRQGVHPLDRLIHFTKRSGKYTPITSIDFMRIRAADSGEMAGSDDPAFEFGHEEYPDLPTSATVTVYRLTQGQRFAYTATARWSEYKPEQNDFMWRKMPHTMLGKCAEALALRKGFPRQLAGLYAKEEMDQADNAPKGYVVEAPSSSQARAPEPALYPSVPNGGVSGAPSDSGPDLGVDLPEGASLIVSVETKARGAAAALTLSTGEVLLTYKAQIAALAETCCQERRPVFLETKISASGNPYVVGLKKTLTGDEVAGTKWSAAELSEQGL